MSPDYLKEIYGWSGWTGSGQLRKKTLPYHDPMSLMRVRNVGRQIATKPTGISAMSKLVSYTVGNGHAYKVAARMPAITNKRRLQAQQNRSAQLQNGIEVQLEQMNWLGHQQESYERLIRDGECFRRIWPLGNSLDVTYIEPEDIDQPTSITQVELATVPELVRSLFDGNSPPGELGIVSDPDDVRRVLGYWMKREDSRFEFLSATSVQHLKDGVDSNDPRGVPRFYWAFCHVMGIDEVDGAMRDLFLVQAKHAAVYNYEQSSLISDIKRLASRQHAIEDAENDGRPASPGVLHAKGFTVEVPGINVAARDAVEIIQQEQRLVGGCSDIPEHLISEDANTGNRSSLVAAEGPFDRRIQREQRYVWSVDRPIIWMIAGMAAGISGRELQDTILEYAITPAFPAAHARDIDKQRESVALLVDKQLMSRRQGRTELGVNNDEAEQDIATQEPLEEPANNSGNPRQPSA
jgi:hypothetical protein